MSAMERGTDPYDRPPYGEGYLDRPTYAGNGEPRAEAYGRDPAEFESIWGPRQESEPALPTRTARRGGAWKRYLGPLIALGVILIKFGAKLKLLLLALTKVKMFATSASMLVSIAAYALIWGWRFAVGFVALLFVHEMGHVIQARKEGIKASAPMFIPFLGAAIMLKELPNNAAAEARIGLAGPVLGSLGCLVPLGLGYATGEEFWLALAFTGFFLNLFNLLPVLPLDGGRAMAALSPWMWIIGFGLLIGVAIAYPNPIMLLIILFGGLETWRRWKERKSPEGARFLSVTPGTRVAVATVYLGLAALLALGMDASFVERDLDDARRDPAQAG